MLVDRAVEGVILLNTPVLETLSVPAVSISGHQKVRGVTNITVDHKMATLAALEHLVNLGHKEIAFFKGHKGSADTEYRWRGILHAAARLGINIRPEVTVQLQKGVPVPGPSRPEEGYLYGQQLLATGRPFTALFAFNDISAIGAMRAFKDAGLRVPEDISVVGFDDIQASSYLMPRLTTVKQPLREMGELAAKQLLQRISNGNGRAPQTILLKPELVVRESTGPARSNRSPD